MFSVVFNCKVPVILNNILLLVTVEVQFTAFLLINPYISGLEEPPWDEHLSVKFVGSQRSLDKLSRMIGLLNGAGRHRKDNKILQNMTYMEKGVWYYWNLFKQTWTHEEFPPKFPVIDYPEFKKILLNISGNSAKFSFCANVFPK